MQVKKTFFNLFRVNSLMDQNICYLLRMNFEKNLIPIVDYTIVAKAIIHNVWLPPYMMFFDASPSPEALQLTMLLNEMNLLSYCIVSL